MDPFNQEKIELKPCPFCGCSAKFTYFETRWWVACVNESAFIDGKFDPKSHCGVNSSHRDTKDEAAAAWNIRS